MDKNDMMKGLQKMAKKPEKKDSPKVESPRAAAPEAEKPKAVGRPKKHEPYEKTTVTFPAELMGKLRMLCLYDDRQIREVLEESLGNYIADYEKQHGAIRVPPRFREGSKK